MTNTPQLVRVVQIGTECLAIAKALDELRVAFGNDNRSDAALYASPLRQELAGYREALRQELLAYSDNPLRSVGIREPVEKDTSPEIDIWSARSMSGLRSTWRTNHQEIPFRKWLTEQESGLMDLPSARHPYTVDRSRWINALVVSRALGKPDFTFRSWLSAGIEVSA